MESVLEDPSLEAHLRQFCLVMSVSLEVATLSRMFSNENCWFLAKVRHWTVPWLY